MFSLYFLLSRRLKWRYRQPLLNLTRLIKPFLSILENVSSAHMCFSVAGHGGQYHNKADLSPKKNFFSNFLYRFGFLVQFYPYPQLGLKKYAQDQELLIFGVFF